MKTIIPVIEPFTAASPYIYEVFVTSDKRTAHVKSEPTHNRNYCALTHSRVSLRRGDRATAVSIDEYGLDAVYVARADGTTTERQVTGRNENLRLFALKELLALAQDNDTMREVAQKVASGYRRALESLDEDDNSDDEPSEKAIRARMAKAVITWETREDGTVVGTLGTGSRPQPIETTYAGCRFRSRLESRWAIALDNLGITWDYEIQGFETTAGPYLPDFRLPDLKIWLEIKPEPVEDPRHAAFAATLLGGWRFIVAAGNIPDPRGLDDPERDVTEFEASLLGRVSIEEIKASYTAARSARFEHGETP